MIGQREFIIGEVEESGSKVYEPRGGGRELWKTKHHEVLLSGPAETGKTWSCMQKLDSLCWKYPGVQCVIARKTLNTIYGTVLQSYSKVINPDAGITFYGGSQPKWIDYPNGRRGKPGSRIWIAGLDNPGKALSAERDFIVVNQAEELTLDDWETLTTRVTGRARNSPYPQIFGDCNPGPPHHWIKHRPSLKLLESRHQDNPTLFDENGVITPDGIRTLAILDALTGARYHRLRLGAWRGSEGVVYESWDIATHWLTPFVIPSDWRRFRSIDFGFNNPFVCQWWALDPDDRLYLYREIFMTGRLVSEHAEVINRLTGDEKIEETVADHDAEGRETLNRAGIRTVPAHKPIITGIQAVQERLKVSGDGKPRLMILQNSLAEDPDPVLLKAHAPVSTVEEFDSYINKPNHNASPFKDNPVTEVPLKKNDHGMDAMRYMVAHIDLVPKLPRTEGGGTKDAYSPIPGSVPPSRGRSNVQVIRLR